MAYERICKNWMLVEYLMMQCPYCGADNEEDVCGFFPENGELFECCKCKKEYQFKDNANERAL